MKLIDCIRPFVNKVHSKVSPVAISFHVWSHLISPYLLTAGIEMEQVIFINNRLKNKLERVSLHANLFTFVVFLIFTRGLRLIQTAQKLRIIVQILCYLVFLFPVQLVLKSRWGGSGDRIYELSFVTRSHNASPIYLAYVSLCFTQSNYYNLSAIHSVYKPIGYKIFYSY